MDNSPTDASTLDGFDEIFTETVALVDSLELGLISLNPTLDETFAEADTLDPGPLADDITGFTASLAVPGTNVDNLGTLLGSLAPPTPAAGSCGAGSAGSGPPCGTHGESSISLDDHTDPCEAATTLPKASIKDGKCVWIFKCDGSQFPGKCNVSDAQFYQGDSRLFAISHDTAPGSTAGSCISRVIFTVSPYKRGHFLARFKVSTNRKSTPEIWCIIIDVIA